MAESEEELKRLKSLLMKVKEENEKVELKLNILKTKIMASGPITSWQIDGETLSDFIFGGSKITADGDCSHEIKRRLLLVRKVMEERERWRREERERWRREERERWRRNRMGRSLSPSQIPQKNISTWSKLHKTTSVGWQRTSGNQKSRPLFSKKGREKI